jgi:hypothetical protein
MKRAIVLRAVVVGLLGLALVLGQTPAAGSGRAMDDERMAQMMKIMGEMQDLIGEMGQMRAMMEQHRGQMMQHCPAAGPAQPAVPHK